MLFDPRHDKNPNIAGFALFCASKPLNEAYNWSNCQLCAVGQYLKSLAIEPHSVSWTDDIDVMNSIARGNYGHGANFDKSQWTFGKLSDRILKHQMAKEKV